MTIRQWGKPGKPANRAGLGCMSFGGAYGPATKRESFATMAEAIELGVDFWDTADIYGEGVSETLIGEFLAQDKTRRDKIVLATKFGNRVTPGGGRMVDNSAPYLAQCIEASLKRLRVDHVDLYYVHRLDKNIPIERTVEAMAPLVKAGKIGAIGLSEVAPDTLRRAHAVHPIAAVQSEYSLWTRTPEVGMLQTCREVGASFVAFSTVGRGAFGGALRDVTAMAEADFRRGMPRFQGDNWARNLARIDRFAALAHGWGVKPATLANAWALAKDDNILIIPGTRTPQHLRENAKAGALKLTPDQIAAIEAILPSGFAAGDRYGEKQWGSAERYA